MFAVEVQNLRKEFFRRDATRTRLRKRRRRVAALEDVTFTIERGECVAILGQNGSGKSTLVRVLSTLLLPDGGSARIFGHDVLKEQRSVQRLVNRVSVEASFFKKMSSEENLAYAARFYGIPPSKTRHAIPEILGRIDSRLPPPKQRVHPRRLAILFRARRFPHRRQHRGRGLLQPLRRSPRHPVRFGHVPIAP